MNPEPGYCFVTDNNWRWCSDENWDTEILDDTDQYDYVGSRHIDGVLCQVWQGRESRLFVAQVSRK